MQQIPMDTADQAFARCWRSAGLHLQAQGQGSLNAWLRAHLNPPFLEHLSFRLGNQLFFVRIEDTAGRLRVPGTVDGLMYLASECRGHPCLMLMRQTGEDWSPIHAGWGLTDVASGRTIDPPSLVTDELIEMTDWELHDFAVQVVRERLAGLGRQVMTWQGNPDVDPAVWFVGNKGPEWVVVRATRYPASDAKRPANWQDIAAQCSALSSTGHFASVRVANAAQNEWGNVVPLWRGQALTPSCVGLCDP